MSSPSSTIFAGIRGTVVAIDRESGDIRWSTDLKGADFVNVTLQDGDLFAASKGRLYRLRSRATFYGATSCRGSVTGSSPLLERRRRPERRSSSAARLKPQRRHRKVRHD